MEYFNQFLKLKQPFGVVLISKQVIKNAKKDLIWGTFPKILGEDQKN